MGESFLIHISEAVSWRESEAKKIDTVPSQDYSVLRLHLYSSSTQDCTSRITLLTPKNRESQGVKAPFLILQAWLKHICKVDSLQFPKNHLISFIHD